MKEKIEIIKLKIVMLLMGGMIVFLLGNLLEGILQDGIRAEYFVATKRNDTAVTMLQQQEIEQQDVEQQEAIPSQESVQPSFAYSNFDKIRVVITNKETGSIYHEDVECFRDAGYRGELEYIKEADGYVVINELSIEEYLYSVVPSEMPAGYPLEALKAQAICARTYACLHILTPGYPQWDAHVDDTTAYQVYHSVSEQEKTTRAVNETEGMVLLAPDGNSLAQTYYYSTSCGYGSDAHVWRTRYADCYPYIKSKHINAEDREQKTLTEEEFAAYITSVNETDYEAEESWYRWKYEVQNISVERMYKQLKKRYEANPKLILTQVNSDYFSQPIDEFQCVYGLEIIKRETGGVADELLIETDSGIYKVITELNIRYVLNDGCSLIERQDGACVEMNSLLPSGFFIMEAVKENARVSGYIIIGGGFGHGAGMSQNAAKAMAENGLSAEQILAFFYEGCIIGDR